MKNYKFPFKQSAGYIYDKTGLLVTRVFEHGMKEFEINEMAEIMVDALNKRCNEQDIEALLKYHGLNYTGQLFELTANTYAASPEKAEQLFSAMPMQTKKVFIGFVSERKDLPNSAFNFFLNLL